MLEKALLSMSLAALAYGASHADSPPATTKTPAPATGPAADKTPAPQGKAPAPTKTPAKPTPKQPKPGPKEPAPKQPTPKLDEYDAMRFHMHQSFDLVRAIERLLLRGNLEQARRFADAIAMAPDAPAHGPWAAHNVEVRDRAAELARATTIPDACAKETKLALACAGCHVELALAPEFKVFPPAPPDKPTLDARMARHRWAADRLWEGIISGADEPWRAGLEILAAPPLEWEKLAPGRGEHAKKLQKLAETTRRNKLLDLDGRATAYGEMLATCAACHTSPAKPK